MKSKSTKEFLGYAVLPAILLLALFVVALFVGCDEGLPMMKPVINEVVSEPEAEEIPTTVGEVKQPEETSEESEDTPAPDPTMDTDGPTVVEVGYYRDEQLTEPRAGVVPYRGTIFTKVVFSHPMKVVVADDDTARPVLYYGLHGEQVRFRIVGSDVSGDDFASGDAKPLNQHTFVCKYVLKGSGTFGDFSFAVGAESVDLEGNTLPAFYTHTDIVSVDYDKPEVVDISYYHDPYLTDEIQATDGSNSFGLRNGQGIYIKIVFDREVVPYISENGWEHPRFDYCAGEMHDNRIVFRGFYHLKLNGGDPADLTGREVQLLEGTNNTFVARFVAELDSNLDMLEPGRSEVCVSYNNGIRSKILVPSSGLTLYLIKEFQQPLANFPPPYREYTPPESNLGDFVGRVCMPVPLPNGDEWSALAGVAPVMGTTVTITDGPRAGESTFTNEGGYFLFPGVAGNELYLRVEQEGVETKEVIVRRNSHTTLQEIPPNRVVIESYYDRPPQNIPGMILVGMEWPYGVRFIFEEDTVLPHELFCIMRNDGQGRPYGVYSSDKLVIDAVNEQTVGHTGTVLHELTHARQQAIAVLHGFQYVSDWEKTPEGIAYAEATRKDVAETGFEGYGYSTEILYENAADLCAGYWGFYRTGTLERSYIRERMPNRFRWAQEWLHKKYQ